MTRLQQRGLTLVVQGDQPPPADDQARFSVLEIVGQDRPGIVREISRVLAAHQVNVEELETECSSAAMSGETLFRARAQLRIPADCDLAVLRQELEKIAADLIAEINFAEVKAP
ncbi:MAG TPA: ACT domain-containing protein [Candidatus Paceibacterota bacterium]|nr:ACT domain-containing protein [Candidatus Paceibacterota bacterium]